MNIISLLGTVPPATNGGPASIDDLMWLFAALGLSTTAGLRAYLPLLAIGASYYVDPQLLPLQSNFQLLHDPLVLAVLGVLVVIEFALDKVPGIDHLSDAIHTIIRPASGAIIMAGTHNTLSDLNPWVAAAAGALLALSLHGIKATTRPVVTGATIGHGNPLVSLGEDVLALGGTILLLALPLVGFIVMAIILLLLFRVTRPLRRRLFGSRRRAGAKAPGGVAPTTPAAASSARPRRRRDPERPLGGLIGRAARRAGSPVASAYGPLPLPGPAPAPVPVPILAPFAGPAATSAATAPTAPLQAGAAAPMPLQAGAAAPMPLPAPAGVGTGTGDTTVEATHQAPYPPVAPNPVQPLGGQGTMPTTTQTYPQSFPTPSQPPWNYPGNAPTLPGNQQP